MTKLLIVEDEPLWQTALSSLIDTRPDLQVVGVVDNAAEAMGLVESQGPDIMLLDWKIKGPVDGLELANTLTEGVHAQYAPWQVIMITGSPREQLGDIPYGFVPKPAIAQRLLQAIDEALLQGGAPQS
ncbi:MAG: response regulator transcription factor [Cyanobacteria bacterium HKST-UBA04]|nr:response regulator transcription factor [Cyanobacteria bacterium HKST-UBA04]MCA9842349.1 response regulator transcription factor [Cyanobacteria bacterium HKST-UBA03]